MSATVRFEKELNCFWFEITGSESRLVYFNLIREMFDHPEYRPGMDAIWDLREADLGKLDSATAMDGAMEQSSMAERRGESRIVVVVRDEYSYGMVRMYLGYSNSDHLQIHICYDLEEAKRFIAQDAGS